MTDEEIAKLKTDLTEARAQAAAAAKEAAGWKAQAEQLPTLQQQIAQANERIAALGADRDAHLALVDAGVTDPSVRDYSLHLYGRHRAEAGDKAQPFGDWLAATKAAPPAILAPFLAPAAQAAPGAPPAPGTPPAPPRANTEAGVKPSPSAPAPWSAGAIANLPPTERIRGTDAAKGLTISHLGGAG